ncbi:hypothetical protein GCHA_1368 [Paraglaciecola chathamensis S18K6]|uniref:Uncharacterized protein n=1 Tax=Paraglaciecola chathamensis S18K6 TaxID=1127672 RepID=A0AAV3UW55_9ALTE|nr:hypothetical protein GCHA_1368 [Paraglaciecola chathamensis S18K6]
MRPLHQVLERPVSGPAQKWKKQKNTHPLPRVNTTAARLYQSALISGMVLMLRLAL